MQLIIITSWLTQNVIFRFIINIVCAQLPLYMQKIYINTFLQTAILRNFQIDIVYPSMWSIFMYHTVYKIITSNMEIILFNIIQAYFHWNIHQTSFPPFIKNIVRYTINYIFNSILKPSGRQKLVVLCSTLTICWCIACIFLCSRTLT